MLYRFFVVCCGLILAYTSSSAQVWEWVQSAGSDKNVNFGSSVTTDALGNIYVVGCHHPALHMHKNVESRRTISLVNTVVRNDRMFIAKYNPRGELLWANHSVGRFVEARDVAVDGKGNAYVCGKFSSKTMFGSRDGNNKRLLGYEPGMMFLAKYTAAGNLVWVVKGGNRQGENTAEALVIEGDRIFLIGYTQVLPNQALTFHSADYSRKEISLFEEVQATGNMAGCVVIYDQAGKLRDWRFIGGQNAQVYLRDIKMDRRGNYFLSGTFSGNFRIHSQRFQTESEQEEGILLAFDIDKRLQWHTQIEGRFAANSWPRLALHHDKLAYSFACEGKARIFAPRSGARFLGSEASWEQSFYVCQTDLRGNKSWQFQARAPLGGMGAHDLTFNPQGQLLVTGHYTDELQLGTTLLKSRGQTLASGVSDISPDTDLPDKNLFVLQLNQRGHVAWAMSSENGRYEIPYAITADVHGRIYTTGYFNAADDVTFGRAPVRPLGEVNIFLARIHPDKYDHEIRYPQIPMPEELAEETKAIKGRQLVLRQEITVKSPDLDIYLWDNRQIDGDIISLYMGDSCVLKDYMLRAQPQHLTLRISADSSSKLILYAENVGEIGPNTAAITVADGHSRQRVHLQAGLDRSEGLTIHYGGKPIVAQPEVIAATGVKAKPEMELALPEATSPKIVMPSHDLQAQPGRWERFKGWVKRLFRGRE